MANITDPFQHAGKGNTDYFKTVELAVIEKARDKIGNTLLSKAASAGQLSCCEVIYRRCPQLLYETTMKGNTPLHQAAWCGKVECIKFLLTAKSKLEKEVTGIEKSGGEQVDYKLLMMGSIGNDTALHLAVRAGRLLPAKILIEADASKKLLTMKTAHIKDTPMHYAVRYHQPEIVKLLVEVDPNIEYSANASGMTPIFMAWQEALLGDVNAVEIRKLLIEKLPSQCILPTDENRWTLIHHATHKGDLRTIKEIIHFWPNCCDLVDEEGQSFLHIAVKFEKFEVLNYILELTHIADNVLNVKDNYGNTPLHVAILLGNQATTLALLNNPRVDKMAENKEGKKALDMASNVLLETLMRDRYPIRWARKGHANLFRALQVKLLQESRDGDGESVLSVAAKMGHLNCCEVISEICPELLYQTNKNGFSALHTAASNAKDEVIKFLLKAMSKMDKQNLGSGGADDIIDYKLLTMVGKNQQTALHVAVEKGHFQSAKLLIEADSTKELSRMIDNQKETAMHYAVKNHNLDIVKLLIEADSDFEYSANESGDTPLSIALHEAAFSSDQTRVEIRKILIQKQSSQCRVPVGTDGWTILHHATSRGDLGAIEEILQSCVDCSELADNKKQNFLHLAAKFEHENVVKFIMGLSTISDNVFNWQDINGDTPLHIAASKGSETIAKLLLYNSRVSKMVKNKQGKSPLDTITFAYSKRKAKVLGLVDGVDEKELKDQSDFDLLVGALISTVSFTVGITVPGGFNSDGRNKGMAILHKKGTFLAFVAFNTIALAFSLFAVLIHFCLKNLEDEREITLLLHVATICSIGAIFAMMASFIMGSLAVLSASIVLVLIVCGICSIFFLCAFYLLWRMIRQKRRRRRSKSE